MAVEIYADTIGELFSFQEWMNAGSVNCPSLAEIYPDLEIDMSYDIFTDKPHAMLSDDERNHIAGIEYEDGTIELAKPYECYEIEIKGGKNTNDTGSSK